MSPHRNTMCHDEPKQYGVAKQPARFTWADPLWLVLGLAILVWVSLRGRSAHSKPEPIEFEEEHAS